MKFSIPIKHYHPALHIGLEDVRNAWLLSKDSQPVQNNNSPEDFIRFPVSGKRISYRALKKGLIKKTMTVDFPPELLPF